MDIVKKKCIIDIYRFDTSFSELEETSWDVIYTVNDPQLTQDNIFQKHTDYMFLQMFHGTCNECFGIITVKTGLNRKPWLSRVLDTIKRKK